MQSLRQLLPDVHSEENWTFWGQAPRWLFSEVPYFGRFGHLGAIAGISAILDRLQSSGSFQAAFGMFLDLLGNLDIFKHFGTLWEITPTLKNFAGVRSKRSVQIILPPSQRTK